MELGYFMMPLHHADSVYNTTLQDDIEAIVYADELGYTEAWCGEHYSAAVEQITSPLLFHANLIARTKQIKFATGVICLPQYHPAVVAGQAAMFDHLSNGRFIMGVGPGGLPSDFELFGVLKKDRVKMGRGIDRSDPRAVDNRSAVQDPRRALVDRTWRPGRTTTSSSVTYRSRCSSRIRR